MKKLLPILVLLFASFSSYSQNWNPLNPGVRNYFTNANSYLKGMEVDSVSSTGSDLKYHLYHRIRRLSWGYSWAQYNGGQFFFEDTIGSWLGRDVIRKPNGNFVFPNHWGDSIVIRPFASLGDNWIFYHDSSTKYYTAEVITLDTMTVLGVVDSVKRIRLSAYDNGNFLNPADSFNNAEIVLSKAHGFETIMELYFFPFFEPGTTDPVDDYFLSNSLVPAYQAGNNVLQVGQHNGMFHLIDFTDPPALQVYDWNVGDIYEYRACFVSWISGYQQCDPPYNNRLDTIISKTVTNSGVEYIRKGWQSKWIYNSNGYFSHDSMWSTRDTISYSNSGEFYLNGEMPEKNDQFGGWEPPDLNYYYNSGASFQKQTFIYGLGGHGNSIYYAQGVGLVASSYFSNGDWPINGYNDLIYSVRSGIPAGTYFFPDTTAPVVNYITNINEISPITIYPNPASGQLNIETSMYNYQLSLINVTGQIVYHKDVCKGKQNIDVERLANGVYNLRLETAEHEVINRKVVIQN